MAVSKNWLELDKVKDLAAFVWHVYISIYLVTRILFLALQRYDNAELETMTMFTPRVQIGSELDQSRVEVIIFLRWKHQRTVP